MALRSATARADGEFGAWVYLFSHLGDDSGFTMVRDMPRLRTAGNLPGRGESLGELAVQRRDRRLRLGSEAPGLVLAQQGLALAFP